MRRPAAALAARRRAGRAARILLAGLAWLPPLAAVLFIAALVAGKI